VNDRLKSLEKETSELAPMFKDSLFQREILTRVQKLEDKSIEQILELERMYSKINDQELKATRGKPA